MICITTINEGFNADWFLYKIANRGVASNIDFKELKTFKELANDDFETYDLPTWEEYELLNDVNSSLKYQGHASFENMEQEVCVWEREGLLQIDVSDKPICQINKFTRQILILNKNPDERELVMEVVIGPALIMLLSDQGIYCLHAGAVKMPSASALFMSESGNGKSTLSAGDGLQWIQVADDILPITSQETNYVALPHFPQLKVKGLSSTAKKYTPMAIDVVYRITDKEVDDIQFKKIDGVQALLEIIRHTVSAKLFDKKQLSKHLIFANEFLKQVPVYELSYPRKIEQLENLREEVRSHAEGLSGDGLSAK